MKTKKSKRVFKTSRVNDEIFAFIYASACVLTQCQDYSDEATYLAHNLWSLYNQLGGDNRFGTFELERKLRTVFLS